ncbi:MAG: metal ABC transporter ATP-binding protein [Bacteroidetes bacterium]|nr:metal ABC transporter ATP-binding protein [Bacteroidota bacterium]
MNTRQPILELKNVTAGYNGLAVLKDVTLPVYAHDFIGVIGPNGGGKTTLVKVMLGLLKPWKGLVKSILDEKDGRGIGYLPQINQIDRKFPISVKDVILSGLIRKQRIVNRFTRDEIQLAAQMMHDMGIEQLAKKPIGELSGGQLQRVFLCRSVISSPSLLILDEPNTYVDNHFENELYEKLKILNQKMAIIVVSHDIGMISSYVKTIACVNTELHYHESNIISEEQLQAYNCPIKLITHGEIPHTVLGIHNHE